jgi:outer membrane lipopolysaccharide assembly protein LptE/RlpB
VRRAAVIVAAAVAVSGCGYAAMSSLGAVPATVQSLYVDIDIGARGDPEMADALQRALRRVIRQDGRFGLAAAPRDADAVLRVRLASSATRPVAFDEFDDPLDYETTVSVSGQLQANDGSALWKADDIAATRAHAAVAGAVVTSSSAFVSSERLRPDDLATFDTVQLGEQRRVHARDALASDLAATIYLRMMEAR